MKKTFFWVKILMGILLGISWTFSPGGVFILALLAGTLLCLSMRVSPQERRFVRILFLTGFLVRALFSLGLDAAAWFMEGKAPFGVVASS